MVPVVFFGLMCIPKHYIKPQPRPREIMSRPYDLDMGLTSKPGSSEYYGEMRFTQCRILMCGRLVDCAKVDGACARHHTYWPLWHTNRICGMNPAFVCMKGMLSHQSDVPAPWQFPHLCAALANGFLLLTAGPARFTQSIKILYAPNSTAAGAVMQRFAQAAACPPDPDKKVVLLETNSACWYSKPMAGACP